MSWLLDRLMWLFAPWQLSTQVDELEIKLRRMEIRVSAVSDMIAALNVATDEIASDLAALRDQVANLDPAVAAQFQPLLDRLTELGADPSNPIPPVEG